MQKIVQKDVVKKFQLMHYQKLVMCYYSNLATEKYNC